MTTGDRDPGRPPTAGQGAEAVRPPLRPLVDQRRRRFALPGRREKGDLFAKLSALERAGVAPAQAFAAAARDLQGRLADACEQAGRLAAAGHPPSEIGGRIGLFGPAEAALMKAAETSGETAAVYGLLAQRYRRSDLRLRRLRARLLPPLVLLALALFLRPLPELLLGSLSAAAYGLQSAGVLVALALGAYVASRVMSSGGLGRVQAWVLTHAPLLGGPYLRAGRLRYLEGLTLCLKAGVPMLTGLALAEAGVAVPAMRRRFARIRERVDRGDSFQGAVVACRCMPSDLVQLLRAGELSGRLPETLERIVERECAQLEDLLDQAATWVSHLAYAALAFLIASGVLL